MRDLTREEAKPIMSYDNDIEFLKEEYDAKPVETTVGELASLGAETLCGTGGNQTFKALSDAGFGDRRCLCFYSNNDPYEDKPISLVVGMVCIQCDGKESEVISELAEKADGSLRTDYEYEKVPGFCLFEIE